ncbi:hypothetical protein SEA_NYCEIRAE_3 [Gordonia phage Nyceirae]|uniref:Uncharacterized protein n=1 Tax=Gordonia phage Nyceirae TaxID=1887651 RepID=A0A1C9EHV9_9CAUD|nr:hypothetical protein BIZ68_gp03 [Gordonia phage Nyceirae]AON97366.1 hypothetical protein SEA_NYCEIRAE_3 [Gordonia phage Nyceirae]
MSDDVRADARELLDDITPGPWCVKDGFVYPFSLRVGLGALRLPDAEFLAAAPDLVRRLDDELELAYGQGTMAGAALGLRMDESLAGAADRVAERLGTALDLLSQLHRASQYSDSVDEGFLREVGEFLGGGGA